MSTAYQIGQTYSFTVYPSELLGNNFTNCTVMGIMDAATASQTGYADIYADHSNYYKTLPEGTIQDSATAYSYLKLKLADQTTPIILGIPFIVDSTVLLVTGQVITVTVPGVTSGDLTTIKNLLAAAGYSGTTLTIASGTSASS